MSEGTVFQRSDGRWCAKYKDARGRWRYLYRKSKGETRKALRAALKDRDDDIVPPSKITVGMYLDEWLEDMRDTVSHRTWMTREGFVRNHIKPAIGAKKLSTLTADDASRLYKRKLAGGMAASSVKRIHELLSQALREAVRRKHININPLDNVKPLSSLLGKWTCSRASRCEGCSTPCAETVGSACMYWAQYVACASAKH